jgi:hypothetical protein
LAAEATYARERVALYRARIYGSRMTSPARMRELERAADLASQRLQRFHATPDPSPSPSPPTPPD